MTADGIFALFGPYVVTLVLVLARVGALVGTAPIFSANMVPMHVKAGIVGVLTIFVMVRIGPTLHLGQLSGLGLLGAVVQELVAGGIMGLAVTVLFASLSLAGQLIGIQMGFAIANVMDPQTFQSVGVLAQMLNLLGMMLFLAFDGHLMMLRALFDSFHLLPLGGLSPHGPLIVAELLRLGGRIFELGLRIGVPVVCVVLLVNVGLATIARTVPQVNIFVVGFIITISVGIIILGMSIPATAVMFGDVIREGISSTMKMVRLL